MSVCTQCGHEFGVGRFCLNCGHPVGAAPEEVTPPENGWRTDTAERPAVPSLPEPRYPPYAGESPGTSTGSHRRIGSRSSRRPPWLPWVVVAALLSGAASTGTWLLLRDGDDEPATTARATPAPEPEPEPTVTEEPSDTAAGTPSGDPTETPPGDPKQVAGSATVTVPSTASPNQDLAGNLVSYDGANMLDGVPGTTWRMPGDGSGQTVVIELGRRTSITSVGLVNGYTKTAEAGGSSFDWYAGNRRVLAVEWVFDDGTVVSQDLTETRDVQSVQVDPVTTGTVELRLVSVSPPGEGPSSRDYTAISEISLLGTPA